MEKRGEILLWESRFSPREKRRRWRRRLSRQTVGIWRRPRRGAVSFSSAKTKKTQMWTEREREREREKKREREREREREEREREDYYEITRRKEEADEYYTHHGALPSYLLTT